MLGRVIVAAVVTCFTAEALQAGEACTCTPMQLKLHGVVQAAKKARPIQDAKVEVTVNAAEQPQLATTDANGAWHVVYNFDPQEPGKPCPTCTGQPTTVIVAASKKGYMTTRVEFPFGVLIREEGEASGQLFVPHIWLVK